MLWRGDCRRGTALIHIVASRVGESQAARALGASVTVAPCAPASNYWLTDGSRKQEVRRRPLVSAGVRDSGRLRRSCWQVGPRAVWVGTKRAFGRPAPREPRLRAVDARFARPGETPRQVGDRLLDLAAPGDVVLVAQHRGRMNGRDHHGCQHRWDGLVSSAKPGLGTSGLMTCCTRLPRGWRWGAWTSIDA